MIVSQKEIEAIWKKILKILNSGEWQIIFDNNPNFKGRISPDIGMGNIIFLNPQKDILPTLIHECLHIIFPKKKEEKIEKLGIVLSKEISPKRFKTLAIKMADNLF